MGLFWLDILKTNRRPQSNHFVHVQVKEYPCNALLKWVSNYSESNIFTVEYCWLLNNTGLSCVGPLTPALFFNKYLSCFCWSTARSPQMHWSALFYRGLSIHGFRYPWGSLSQFPTDTEGQVSSGGSQKLNVDFPLYRVSTPNPCVVQGHLYLDISETHPSMKKMKNHHTPTVQREALN